MQVEIIGEQGGEIVARGDYYRGGMKLATLKMYFERGVIRNPKAGNIYVFGEDWLNYMHEIGKIAWIEA